MESPILSHQADDRTLLPSWLLHRTKHQMSTVSNGRLRLVLIASVCITLGYILSTSFATTESHVQGIPSETIDRIKGGNSSKPSLGHALNDLHYAVSDKLSNLLTSSSRSQNTSASNICTFPSTTINSSISEEVLLPDRPALGERLRVAKCTIIFGGSAIYERALQTHEQHDRLHGYPLYVLRHSIMDDVWSKPAYILSLLLRELSKPEEQRLQWLFWVDSDTVLLNPKVRIETFLPPSPEFDDVHLVISRDWNGLNNGVFPVRVNQWAVELFAAIVAFRTFRPDEKLTFRDQQAMDLLIKERRFAANIVEAPQRWFNAYPGEEKDMMFPFQVRRGDLLVQFPGMMNRDEVMAKWLDRVEQHLPEWEVDVGHTTYPPEAREFWAQQRELRENTLMTLVDVRNQSMKLVSRVESELGEYRSKITERKATEVLEKMTVLEELLDKKGSVIEELQDAMAELRLVRYRYVREGGSPLTLGPKRLQYRSSRL